MVKKSDVVAGVAVAGLTGLGFYLYLRSKKVSAISTPIPTTSTLTPIITYTPTFTISVPTVTIPPTPTPTLTPTTYIPTPTSTPSYGQIIGPITSNTTMTINTPHVLVVAVGGGGAGGGIGTITVQGGNGGNTVVTNGSQTVIAGGGQGGWSGNYTTFGGGLVPTCVGCIIGPGGDGGTGSVENVQYYQILNGNKGGNGNIQGAFGGQGGALPSGYNQAIQQVLQEAGINYSVSLTIPSTPCGSTFRFISVPEYIPYPGSGFGAGGCGSAGGGVYAPFYTSSAWINELMSLGGELWEVMLHAAGGGGGSGAVVVALMNGGTFNITVGQGGQLSSNVLYSCPSCSVGLPGVVYLVPLP
jgi:hypothetical protein